MGHRAPAAGQGHPDGKPDARREASHSAADAAEPTGQRDHVLGTDVYRGAGEEERQTIAFEITPELYE